VRDSSKRSDFGKAFKWKSKDKGSRDTEREEKDYRQRDADNYRPRRYGGKDDRERRNDRDKYRDADGETTTAADSKVADKFGGGGTSNNSSSANVKDKFGRGGSSGGAQQPKDKPKPKPAVVAAGPVTYILVTVNDRLGTKATIPCMASDTVGDFKKMVAAHIGRGPHEIMLKRQGERPFKDFITLGDYGVSSGVQLDLELDTGE
jgi:hypothetical protein